jgi:hypothetical protein
MNATQISRRSVLVALIAGGLAGCGSGGIESGIPSNLVVDEDPAKKAEMEALRLQMVKGSKAYEPPKSKTKGKRAMTVMP